MKNKAFTLIELLVVITIVGILSGIVIVAIGDAVDRARIAGSQRFSHSIRTRLALDMVGRWPFEFNAVDFSGWLNDGIIMDGTVTHPNPTFVSGVIGSALSLDGNDSVRVSHRETLNINNNVTVETWVNVRHFTEFPHIAGKQFASEYGYGLIIGTIGENRFWWGTIRRSPDASITRINSNVTVELGRWYHLVMTYSRPNFRIYVDGIFRNQVSPDVLIAMSTEPVRFGTPDPSLTGRFLDGIIDEVRIFRAAVPTSYIQKRYVEGVKSLASSGGISQEEKQERIAELRNSGQLVIDLDAALVGPIDLSPYAHYFEALPPRGLTPR